MGFLRRIAGIFGISKDDADHPEAAAAAGGGGDIPHDKVAAAAAAAAAAGLHPTRRGFSVQVPVPVERQGPVPVLVPCAQGEGGVQSFCHSKVERGSIDGLHEEVYGLVSCYFKIDMVRDTNSSDHRKDRGFRWYTRRLRIDEDGDVADGFLDEVVPESLNNNDTSPVGRFQVKYNTRPTALAMRKQTIVVDGDILHSLEHQGQLRWV